MPQAGVGRLDVHVVEEFALDAVCPHLLGDACRGPGRCHPGIGDEQGPLRAQLGDVVTDLGGGPGPELEAGRAIRENGLGVSGRVDGHRSHLPWWRRL